MYKRLLLLAGNLLLSITIVLAQPTSQVQLIMTEPADCIERKLYVDIEVRAASLADTFRIGWQNYRFAFDNQLAGNPEIEAELELSGYVMDGTNTFAFYDFHNLTVTLDVVSYNIAHLGAGYLLTTDWLSIGRVSFDILATEGCFEFALYDESSMPSTGIGVASEIPPWITANVEVNNLFVCIEDLCTVATEEVYEKTNWKIFPNPVSNQAKVQLEHKNLEDYQVKVEVMNIAGKLVYTEILSDYSFNTTNLLPGMYLVQLKTDNWQSDVRKLIKLK